MAEMRLVVAGAAGRMGQMLVKAIAATEGAVLAAALERPGSAALGQDAGAAGRPWRAGRARSPTIRSPRCSRPMA